MTEPSWFNAAEPGPPPQQPEYPPPYQAAPYDPSAPFGRHPVTGQPYSDKSKTIAGLLQLLGLFGFAGVGRIYAGYIGLGIAQLLVGWLTCSIGAVIWGAIDAAMILSGKVNDPMGRPMRDGT